MSGRLIIEDCVNALPTLEAGSAQLSVTSPPYDSLRTYGGIKPFAWADFEVVAKELYRVLCDGGVLCWNVGDSVVDGSETLTSAKQKIFFNEQCGFRIHDTMIYEKLGSFNPDDSRYCQVFEYVYVLSKGAPRAFNPIADRKNKWAGLAPFGKKTVRNADDSMQNRTRYLTEEFGKRTNVWQGKTASQEQVCEALDHPATMPFWLARDLIQSWSNPGDTILDPFFGSGTTGKAAELLGRKWIGIELNPAYANLAADCTAQQGLVLV